MLVTLAAGRGEVDGQAADIAEHVRAALTGSSAMLGLALVVVLAVLVPRRGPDGIPSTANPEETS